VTPHPWRELPSLPPCDSSLGLNQLVLRAPGDSAGSHCRATWTLFGLIRAEPGSCSLQKPRQSAHPRSSNLLARVAAAAPKKSGTVNRAPQIRIDLRDFRAALVTVPRFLDSFSRPRSINTQRSDQAKYNPMPTANKTETTPTTNIESSPTARAGAVRDPSIQFENTQSPQA